MADYTELHLHDHYSKLDGLNTPAEYMERAKELGMTHLSQTNHGTLGGHREFQEAAKVAGIIPILGVEAYISSTDRFDKRSKASRNDDTSIYNHIILLAQNETGLKNLNYMSELAWTEGFYSKPRIDKDLLFANHEGLIVLSGCMNGLIAKAIESGDLFHAEQVARQFKDVLGDRFYMEVQGHNPVALNQALLEIADKVGIRPVATSDCHYARKEDLWIEEAMLILSTKPKQERGTDYAKSKKLYGSILERMNYLYPERKMSFQEIEIFLRDRKSNFELFEKQGIVREDIYDNTMLIAQRIEEVPYYEGLELLPEPEGNSDDILEGKARKGLAQRGLSHKSEYVERLETELEIIKNKKFSPYFLMVEDFVSWARSQDIPVGPGRGSAAGSLVCYALGITDADPIEHGLLFFRFIDPSRDDFPDIDTDFGDVRRIEIKEYLGRKYGNVASIATYAQFQGKNALKDAARVLGVPIGDVNRATKNNDAPNPNAYYFDTFDYSEQGKVFTAKYPEAVDLAKRLHGRIRSGGMHAAGVVVANQPISNFAPVETSSDPKDKTGPRLTYIANDKKQVAKIGLIKLDILGLKNLTIIDETIKDIALRKGMLIKLEDIPFDDAKVYKMLESGHTQSIFQAEGHTFTKWILETKCDNFNDLVIGTSIARPGPLNTVGEIYKKRLFKTETVTYQHESMKRFTEETLGLIVYQEQVMLAMTDLAGMSMSTANKVRKILADKDDVQKLQQFKIEFVTGAAPKVGKAVAERLWHDFEAHAGYSFNKSHAVVYSMITYWTAWLKYYYPLEFMAATLRNEDDKDSFTDHLIEIKRLGIPVYLPHVNHSDPKVSIQGDGIRLGLTNIKYVRTAAQKIINARPFASFKDLSELASQKGSGINANVIKALNFIGAARFYDNPLTGNERDYFYEYMKVPAFPSKDIDPRAKVKFRELDEFDEEGVFPIMAMARGIKRGPGWARVDFVDETGSAGVFTGADTLIETGQMYAMLIADNRIAKYMTVDELAEGIDNAFYKWLIEKSPEVPENKLRVISFKSHTTKAGKKMGYVVVQDDTGLLFHVLAFPQKFISAYSKCKEGALIEAEIRETDDGTLFFEEIK